MSAGAERSFCAKFPETERPAYYQRFPFACRLCNAREPLVSRSARPSPRLALRARGHRAALARADGPLNARRETRGPGARRPSLALRARRADARRRGFAARSRLGSSCRPVALAVAVALAVVVAQVLAPGRVASCAASRCVRSASRAPRPPRRAPPRRRARATKSKPPAGPRPMKRQEPGQRTRRHAARWLRRSGRRVAAGSGARPGRRALRPVGAAAPAAPALARGPPAGPLSRFLLGGAEPSRGLLGARASAGGGAPGGPGGASWSVGPCRSPRWGFSCLGGFGSLGLWSSSPLSCRRRS